MSEDILLKGCVLFKCGYIHVRETDGPEGTERDDGKLHRRDPWCKKSVSQRLAQLPEASSQNDTTTQNTIRKHQSYCTGTRKQLAIPTNLSERPTDLPVASDGGRTTRVRRACTTRVHRACTMQGNPHHHQATTELPAMSAARACLTGGPCHGHLAVLTGCCCCSNVVVLFSALSRVGYAGQLTMSEKNVEVLHY